MFRMKRKHAEYFLEPQLFYEVSKLMSTYPFQLPVRRFVWFELLKDVEFTLENLQVFDTPFEDSDEFFTARSS